MNRQVVTNFAQHIVTNSLTRFQQTKSEFSALKWQQLCKILLGLVKRKLVLFLPLKIQVWWPKTKWIDTPKIHDFWLQQIQFNKFTCLRFLTAFKSSELSQQKKIFHKKWQYNKKPFFWYYSNPVCIYLTLANN